MSGTGRWRGSRGEWWVVGQVALLVALAVVPPRGPRLLPLTPWTAGAGAVLALAGGAFLAAGGRALGRALSPLPAPRPGAQLVRRGIYRWVRHPVYAGVILLAAGWAVFRASAVHLALALAVAVLLVAKASYEERLLVRRYPEYEEYRRTTRRFLPWLF